MWQGPDPLEARPSELVGRTLGLRVMVHEPSHGHGLTGCIGDEVSVEAFLAQPHRMLARLYLLQGRIEAVVDGQGRREPWGAVVLDPRLPRDRRRPGAARAWVAALRAPSRWRGQLVGLRRSEDGWSLVRAGWRGADAPQAWMGRTVLLRLRAFGPLDEPVGDDPWTHRPLPFWTLWDGSAGEGRHLVFDRPDAAEAHAQAMPNGRYAVSVWRVEDRLVGRRPALEVEEARAYASQRAKRLGSYVAIVRRGPHRMVVGGATAPWSTAEEVRAWAATAGVDALVAVWDASIDRF